MLQFCLANVDVIFILSIDDFNCLAVKNSFVILHFVILVLRK